MELATEAGSAELQGVAVGNATLSSYAAYRPNRTASTAWITYEPVVTTFTGVKPAVAERAQRLLSIAELAMGNKAVVPVLGPR